MTIHTAGVLMGCKVSLLSKMDLLEGFFKFLKTQQMLSEQDVPTLLAVSGGLDSVVMAHLFRAANLPFAIAHCNFQLRDAESEHDELFVQELAQSFDVHFFSKRFETRDYAESNGFSIQMAARELRYRWFAEIAVENNFCQIATAHHLNDSVETALLNFVRGTGLAGLRGIDPSPGFPSGEAMPTPSGKPSLVRPLLFATRAEIEAYAQQHKLLWREDSSNATDDYARNFVRHHIVPRLEELNPNFIHTAARNMKRISSADDNLIFLLSQWFQMDGLSSNQAINNLRLDKQKLTQLPSPRQALRQLLKPYGFDAEQTRQLAENLAHIGLELKSEKAWHLLNDRTEILLRPSTKNTPEQEPPIPDTSEQATHLPLFIIQEDDLMVSLPDGSRLVLIPSGQDPFATDERERAIASRRDDPQSAMVDADRLRFPLHLRHWQPGDSFQPLGMAGKSQKLQDFFTNQKLSRFEKEQVWLLLNTDGAVVWVLGWRLDERFKIQSDTKKVLKINWIK